ncbi:hypothetical protein PHK61_30895 [Actinomycetospora lutea]|uniref:hypothetical protein n=1 Tax=Actinomycetospora lutea TaxID=663604 RepID=UPI0023667368|nr:hypothetical protein [Actinomycetospora lutea]MDD7942830.1 hypothetical protein [Actinomycetospora lutea]
MDGVTHRSNTWTCKDVAFLVASIVPEWPGMGVKVARVGLLHRDGTVKAYMRNPDDYGDKIGVSSTIEVPRSRPEDAFAVVGGKVVRKAFLGLRETIPDVPRQAEADRRHKEFMRKRDGSTFGDIVVPLVIYGIIAFVLYLIIAALFF